MSTLFLIGNGFDLNCGMKTSYAQVYKAYFKEPNESEVISRFKKQIQSDIANWGDFECAMAEYATKLDSESDFIECLNDFLSFLSDYLREEEAKFLSELKAQYVRAEVIDEMRTSISTFYEGVSNNLDTLMKEREASLLAKMHVISFNYTKAFDAIFTYAFQNVQTSVLPVIHIHGGVNDPTMGIDRDEQIKAKFPITRRVRRYFVKPFFNEHYDANRVTAAENAIKEAFTICVFGMSLGPSDLTWRNKLVEWLQSSTINQLILYDYEMSKRKFKTVQERQDIEEKAKIRKLMEWGVSDVDSVIEQFHIVCGKNIFNFEDAVARGHGEKRRNT